MEKLTIDNVKEVVYSYPTKHEVGFTPIELNSLLEEHRVSVSEFFYRLGIGHTCMVIGGETIRYHHDILTALRCVIENRDMTIEEWD